MKEKHAVSVEFDSCENNVAPKVTIDGRKFAVESLCYTYRTDTCDPGFNAVSMVGYFIPDKERRLIVYDAINEEYFDTVYMGENND